MSLLESWRRDGRKQTRRVLRRLNARYFALQNPEGYNTDGVDVFAADWDTLVILDACRYDIFAERSSLAGDLERRTSRGSMTREWVVANFTDRQLHDTVYVTANGNYAHVADDIGAELHAVVGLWGDEYRTDPANEVVFPETVTDAAIEANDTYPNKRLLVHYVQPHYPFIGPTGREHFDSTATLTELADARGVARERIREAYRENLDVVLEETERLLAAIDGRTVVTADHGELLGERLFPIPMRDYGHPGGIYVDELVEVPWHVHETGDRRRVVSEPSGLDEQFDREAVRRNLQGLGYVD